MITDYQQKKIKHIAITIAGNAENPSSTFALMSRIMKMQILHSIPIVTIRAEISDQLFEEVLRFYVKKKFLEENKIKVTFLGKWYDQSQSIVEVIKDLVKTTAEHNSYHLNFLINYDGQEEIVDACKILCRQLLAQKMSLEQIDKTKIKENMYSSYFVPPDRIIKIGGSPTAPTLEGFLLWDSFHAEIFFIKNDAAESPDIFEQELTALFADVK